RIKDEKLRGEVVTLIATGMEPADAIAEVMKDQAPKAYNASAKESHAAKREARAAAQQEAAPKLSDDEWYETYCAEFGKHLKHPEKFRNDCILFRHISDARHGFRVKVKKHLATAKARG